MRILDHQNQICLVVLPKDFGEKIESTSQCVPRYYPKSLIIERITNLDEVLIQKLRFT